jgi:DNA damage-binding protein 1
MLATASGLVIGKVGELNKLHIRSVRARQLRVGCLPYNLQVPLGLDNPRRIAYDEAHKVLAVAFTRSEPWRVGNPEVSRSFLRLLDCSSFSGKADGQLLTISC